MKLYFRLVSALIKGVEPNDKEKKRNKIFYIVMSIIAAFGIILPMAFFVGVIIYTVTGTLTQTGTQENGIEMFLHLIAAFSFIFGLNVFFSVFYFSGDIENLLPLPLKPYQIIASKFTAAMISESVMECIVIIAALTGYIFGGNMPLYSWLISIIGTLTMPILPLIYCGIICMVVMYFTRFIRNKDTVNKITGVFTFLVIAGIVYFIAQSGFDSQKLINALSTPDNAILRVMNIIFPTVPLLVSSMGTGSIPNILIYLAVNLASIAVFMFIAQIIYFPGVSGVGQAMSHSGKFANITQKMKQHRPCVSYLKKELRILIRTPAYFTNCVMINFLIPIFVYLAYLIHKQTNFLESLFYGIHSGNEETVLIFMLGISAVSVLVTALNCIASSGITREGKHFSFIKYIPLDYTAQLNVKAAVSIIISGSGMIISVIAACILLNTGFKFTVFCCLLSLISVTFATYLGIYMDSVNPKLIWDDELNALRGNYNIFFNMALAIVTEAVICAGSYLLFKFTELGSILIIIILFVMLMLLTTISYLLCCRKATKNISTLE